MIKLFNLFSLNCILQFLFFVFIQILRQLNFKAILIFFFHCFLTQFILIIPFNNLTFFIFYYQFIFDFYFLLLKIHQNFFEAFKINFNLENFNFMPNLSNFFNHIYKLLLIFIYLKIL